MLLTRNPEITKKTSTPPNPSCRAKPPTAGMTRINTQIVKALLGSNNRILGVVNGIIMWRVCKVFLNLRSDDPDRVVRFGVQSLAHEGGNVWWNVIVWMVREVPGGVGVGCRRGFLDGRREDGGG